MDIYNVEVYSDYLFISNSASDSIIAVIPFSPETKDAIVELAHVFAMQLTNLQENPFAQSVVGSIEPPYVRIYAHPYARTSELSTIHLSDFNNITGFDFAPLSKE